MGFKSLDLLGKVVLFFVLEVREFFIGFYGD